MALLQSAPPSSKDSSHGESGGRCLVIHVRPCRKQATQDDDQIRQARADEINETPSKSSADLETAARITSELALRVVITAIGLHHEGVGICAKVVI